MFLDYFKMSKRKIVDAAVSTAKSASATEQNGSEGDSPPPAKLGQFNSL